MSRRDVVLDTNCLVQMLSAASPYYAAWRAFIEKRYTLCVSNEILSEYQEVIERVTGSPAVAENVMLLLINSRNLRKLDPHFHFGLIERDPDDNKFVDCAILTTDDEAYTLPATLLRELMDTAAQQDAQGLTLTDEELNREMQQW